MHRRVFTESRRARLYAGDVPGTLLPAPRDYEWLEMTRACGKVTMARRGSSPIPGAPIWR